LLLKVLEVLRNVPDCRTVLIMTKGAEYTLACETYITLEEAAALADEYYSSDEITAGPASGSYDSAGMLVVPCSMKTLAGICSGYADNLLLRSADVMLKEKKTLVLCPRECPLSPVHLRNMLELSELPNVHIMPPMQTFYYRPETINEMLFQTAARLLVPFDIEAEGRAKWNGM